MGKPSPPSPPNPVDTARASTSTNVGTSITNAYLGNTNQITPDGSLTYETTGEHTWDDPYTGLSIKIPTFTATQKLSDAQQAIKDQTDAAKVGLAGMANYQTGRLSNLMKSEIDLSKAPTPGDPSGIGNILAPSTSFGAAGDPQASLGDYGKQLTEFGDAGAITKDYGPADNFSADRGRVEGRCTGGSIRSSSASAATSSSASPTRAFATAVRPTRRRWMTTIAKPMICASA